MMRTIGMHPLLQRGFLAIRQVVHVFLLSACLGLSFPAIAADYDWQGVDRVVAVGDLHGDYSAYMEILVSAGLVGETGEWVGGQTHLVQTGDIPDRGPDSIRIILHLQRLKKEAKKAGGRVHTLIGNHEAMNLTGDVRYVHSGEYEYFVTDKSSDVRDNYYTRFQARVRQMLPQDKWPTFDDAYRAKWLRDRPLGYVEHQRAWNRKGKFGRWVAKNPTIIRINGTLFMHGGLSPLYRDLGLSKINKQIRKELRASSTQEQPMSDDELGPLWYRGLAQNDDATEGPNVDAIMARYDAERIVIGHSTTMGPVLPRFGGRVILIDTGISKHYGGHTAYLVIEGDTVIAVHHGVPLVVPGNDDGALLEYLTAVGNLVTDQKSLNNRINEINAVASTESR